MCITTVLTAFGSVEGAEELTLKFFSCTTGQSHPEATRPTVHLGLSESMPLEESNWSFHITVFGGLVGLAIYVDDGSDDSAELWVLDWRTGRILLVRAQP